MKKSCLFVLTVALVALFSGCKNQFTNTDTAITVTLPEHINQNARAAGLPENNLSNSPYCYYALRLTKTDDSGFKPIIIKAVGGQTVRFSSLKAGAYKVECAMAEASREDWEDLEKGGDRHSFYSYFGSDEVILETGETGTAVIALEQDFSQNVYFDRYYYVEEDSAYYSAQIKNSSENCILKAKTTVYEVNKKTGKKAEVKLDRENDVMLENKGSQISYLIKTVFYYDNYSTWYLPDGYLCTYETVIEFEDNEVIDNPVVSEEYVPGSVEYEKGLDGIISNRNANLLPMNYKLKGNENLKGFYNGEELELNEEFISNNEIILPGNSYGEYVPLYLSKGTSNEVIAFVRVSCPIPEIKFTYAKGENGTSGSDSPQINGNTEIKVAQFTDTVKFNVEFAKMELYSLYNNLAQEPQNSMVPNSTSISECQWILDGKEINQTNATYSYKAEETGSYSIYGKIKADTNIDNTNLYANNGVAYTAVVTVNVVPWNIVIKTADGKVVDGSDIKPGEKYFLSLTNEIGSEVQADWRIDNNENGFTIAAQGNSAELSFENINEENVSAIISAHMGNYILASAAVAYTEN